VTTVINPLVSIKSTRIYSSVEQLWLLKDSIQQIHLYHKRSVTLPRRWCGGYPGRTDHRHKQALCRGCEVDVLVDACILPSPHSKSWPSTHLQYSSDVQPPTKPSICMFNMSNTSALLRNHTSCHKHIKLTFRRLMSTIVDVPHR